MRNHSQIIADADKAEEIASVCGVSVHTVRSWRQRGRIPDEQWMTFVRRGWSALDELAIAVDKSAPKAEAA